MDWKSERLKLLSCGADMPLGDDIWKLVDAPRYKVRLVWQLQSLGVHIDEIMNTIKAVLHRGNKLARYAFNTLSFIAAEPLVSGES